MFLLIPVLPVTHHVGLHVVFISSVSHCSSPGSYSEKNPGNLFQILHILQIQKRCDDFNCILTPDFWTSFRFLSRGVPFPLIVQSRTAVWAVGCKFANVYFPNLPSRKQQVTGLKFQDLCFQDLKMSLKGSKDRSVERQGSVALEERKCFLSLILINCQEFELLILKLSPQFTVHGLVSNSVSKIGILGGKRYMSVSYINIFIYIFQAFPGLIFRSSPCDSNYGQIGMMDK